MRVTPLEQVERRRRRVALGQFDGVHRGHREVIRGCDTVVTFDPHPQALLSPDAPPRLLSPLPRKIQLMRAIGVRELVLVRFDAERAAQPPEAFVDEVLVERLQAESVSVGANFRYGHRAAGDVGTLRADGRFELRAGELLRSGGEPISSTRIRALIADGRLAEAAELLGSPVHLRGEIRHPLHDPGFAVDGALLRFPAASALPPQRAYRCSADGERALLTLTTGLGRGGAETAGWLTGPAVDTGPGVEVALDLEPAALAAEAA